MSIPSQLPMPADAGSVAGSAGGLFSSPIPNGNSAGQNGTDASPSSSSADSGAWMDVFAAGIASQDGAPSSGATVSASAASITLASSQFFLSSSALSEASTAYLGRTPPAPASQNAAPDIGLQSSAGSAPGNLMGALAALFGGASASPRAVLAPVPGGPASGNPGGASRSLASVQASAQVSAQGTPAATQISLLEESRQSSAASLSASILAVSVTQSNGAGEGGTQSSGAAPPAAAGLPLPVPPPPVPAPAGTALTGTPVQAVLDSGRQALSAVLAAAAGASGRTPATASALKGSARSDPHTANRGAAVDPASSVTTVFSFAQAAASLAGSPVPSLVAGTSDPAAPSAPADPPRESLLAAGASSRPDSGSFLSGLSVNLAGASPNALPSAADRGQTTAVFHSPQDPQLRSAAAGDPLPANDPAFEITLTQHQSAVAQADPVSPSMTSGMFAAATPSSPASREERNAAQSAGAASAANAAGNPRSSPALSGDDAGAFGSAGQGTVAAKPADPAAGADPSATGASQAPAADAGLTKRNSLDTAPAPLKSAAPAAAAPDGSVAAGPQPALAQPAPAASSAKASNQPESNSPNPPMISQGNEPAANPLPVRSMNLRVEGESGETVNVRLTDRAGQVQITVHSSDDRTAVSLRQDLSTLSSNLDKVGWKAELSNTSAPSRNSDQSSDQQSRQQSQRQAAEDAEQQSGRRRPSLIEQWAALAAQQNG